MFLVTFLNIKCPLFPLRINLSYNMGKKQNQKSVNKKSTYLSEDFDEFSLVWMAKKSTRLKQFMWKCHKEGKISHKTESVVNKFLNQITDNQNFQSEIDEKLRESQALYLKTSNILKGLSLKEKYSNLLKGKIEQIHLPQRQQLSQAETQKLQKIKRLFRKYRVSSMFRENLEKQLKDKYIDNLIKKGYLKEMKISSNQQKNIVYLTC